ncbi:hypothetical protein PTKIN_Ptkin19aG0023800 [Pterospermum kingtungense]
MATSNPRLCFLQKTNRRKGNSQSLNTYHPQHADVSSYGEGRGSWTNPFRYCVGESSQLSNPAFLSGDLTDSTGLIQVNCPTAQLFSYMSDSDYTFCKPGPAQHYQSKINLKKDSAPLVEKSETTSTVLGSKQLTLKETTQPLKYPAGLAKKSAFSRIKESMHFVKKKKTARPHKNHPDLVENGGTTTTLASNHVMQQKETDQLPKDRLGLVENIGTTSRIPASMHNMQKKKTTQSPKVSVVWVKKGESRSSIPQKEEKTQPSVGSAELVSEGGTGATLPSEQTQPSVGFAELVGEGGTATNLPSEQVRHNKETIPAKPIREQHIYEDHIVWEGFNEGIVPLEKRCVLCEDDLANEPEYEYEYDPDIERLNPAENAVLSCGHVFHSMCLLFCTSEENSRDPPCMICASLC